MCFDSAKICSCSYSFALCSFIANPAVQTRSQCKQIVSIAACSAWNLEGRIEIRPLNAGCCDGQGCGVLLVFPQ